MATTANTTDSALDLKTTWFFKSGSSSVIHRGKITAQYRRPVIFLGTTIIDIFFLSCAQGLKFFNAMNDIDAHIEVPAKTGVQGSHLIITVGMTTSSNI